MSNIHSSNGQTTATCILPTLNSLLLGLRWKFLNVTTTKFSFVFISSGILGTTNKFLCIKIEPSISALSDERGFLSV